MKKLIVLVVLLSACTITNESPDTLIVSDGAIDVMELDTMVPDSIGQDTMKPDKSQPDYGEHKCSPAGYYTFNVVVTKSTCPSSIVKKTSWTTTAFMKSYWCGTHFIDGYSLTDDGKALYCAYYTRAETTGLEQWAECIVYETGRVEYCMFNFGAPFTTPNK